MAPYSPPQKAVQQILSRSQLRITHFEDLPGHLHEICLVHLSNGSRLMLKTSPSTYLCLLRTEQTYLDTEATILELLANTNLPIPRILRHEPIDQKLGSALLLTSHLSGVPFSEMKEYLTKAERLGIERQVRALRSHIGQYTSFTHGPAGLVKAGEGAKTWREAFTRMVESILMDAEDMMVNIPYHQLREAIVRWESYLDDVTEARLMVPGLLKPENILVDRESNEITGILDFGGSIWGDLAMMDEWRGGNIKGLL